MNSVEFRQAVTKFQWIFQTCSPIDTGNLRYNATKSRFRSPKEYKIYIDNNIAPYMTFTNEPWISPKWKGAKNPNENWFEIAIETAIATVFPNSDVKLDGELIGLKKNRKPTRYKPKRRIINLKNFKAKFSKRRRKNVATTSVQQESNGNQR